MTGDHNDNWISSVCCADGANGGRIADARGQLAIGGGGATRNIAQSFPYPALKRGAPGLDRNGVNGIELSGEVTGDGRAQSRRILRGFQGEASFPVVVSKLPADELVVVREERSPEIPFIIRGNHDRADGRGDAIEEEVQDFSIVWVPAIHPWILSRFSRAEGGFLCQ